MEIDGLTSNHNADNSMDSLEKEVEEPECESARLLEQADVQVYKERWFALFIFAVNTTINGMIFISLSSINNIVSKYYGVSSVSIEWLTNMMMFGYAICALPASYLISQFGVRPMLIIGSILQSVTSVFQYIGHMENNFTLIVIGQVFSAIGSSTILQVPGKLSAVWFPESERATATSIGFAANLFGTAIGFLHPTLAVKLSADLNETGIQLKYFFMVRICTCLTATLLSFAYRENPPTSSSPGGHREKVPFIDSLKILMKNKYFIFLSQSHAIYGALFGSMNTLVSPLMTFQFPHGYEELIGWMGFGSIMIAIVSFIVIGKIVDRWHHYRITSTLINASALFIWLVFFITLLNSKNFEALFGIYVLFGASLFPFWSIGIEQAAEMTYPISEETSGVFLLILGNIYGALLILSLGYAVQERHIHLTGYVVAVLYLLSTVFASLAKTEKNRFKAESN